jgi:hypothetical protein
MEGVKDTLNLVVLDACRNNPFERSFRSNTKGLAQMKAPTGTLIAYSTSPGSVASDGAGKNGLYTQELLKAMKTPELKVEEVFKEVRKSVISLSNQQQVPWDASSLVGEFYFIGEKADRSNLIDSTEKTNAKLEAETAEQKYWDSVDKTSVEELNAYLDKYPKGTYANLAGTKIKNIEITSKTIVEEKYWEALDKTKVEELKVYLVKYPNGMYLDLATAKIKNLEEVESRTSVESRELDEKVVGEFVKIPAGEFTMGKDLYKEFREHKVVITKSFEVGKYEVPPRTMGNNNGK